MMRKGEALRVLESELERQGWDNTSSFTVRDTPRDEARHLSWWHEKTPENESSETSRNKAYLSAYLRIAGRDRLQTRGIRLDRGRLWMDRSVISRLERDGYLIFIEHPTGEHEPVFEITDSGRILIS